MDTHDDIEDKRLHARLVLEGDKHREKREKTEAELQKLRKEAVLAMEGAERRTEREQRIKQEAERQAIEQKRQEEIVRLRQIEADRRKAEDEKKRIEKEKTDQVKEVHIEKIHQAEARIESLKQNAEFNTTPVRTLKGDLAQAVAKRKLSTGTVMMEEQKKYASTAVPAENTASSKRQLILVGLLVLILVTVGSGLVWYTASISPVPATVSLNTPKVITAEHTEIINIATTTDPVTVQTEIRNKLKNNLAGVTNIYFTTQVRNPDNSNELVTAWLNPTRFSQLTNITITDGVLRAANDTLTIGTIKSKDGKNVPFIILGIKDYTRALAQMFNWEDTMTDNLSALWPELATPELDVTTNQPDAPAPTFIDQKVNSRDVRILVNQGTTTPILAYTFFNNKYIIITESDQVIDDLIGRLAP